jgi:hypothetical protein
MRADALLADLARELSRHRINSVVYDQDDDRAEAVLGGSLLVVVVKMKRGIEDWTVIHGERVIFAIPAPKPEIMNRVVAQLHRDHAPAPEG